MKAIMLAAGVGKRLYGDSGDQPPKSLLRFDGATLMARHIAVLKEFDVDGLALVVGYRKDAVGGEARNAGGDGFVTLLENPRFREGSMISMWTAREVLQSGDDVLLMDADVLYHRDLIGRLLDSEPANCLLLDRDFDDGDEPVRLCIRDGHPVEFKKAAEGAFDLVGEWPGFLRFSPQAAEKLADSLDAMMAREEFEAPDEDAIRHLILAEPAGTFGFEDITGVPWIEIDFPEDVARAESEILPRINDRAAAE